MHFDTKRFSGLTIIFKLGQKRLKILVLFKRLYFATKIFVEKFNFYLRSQSASYIFSDRKEVLEIDDVPKKVSQYFAPRFLHITVCSFTCKNIVTLFCPQKIF